MADVEVDLALDRSDLRRVRTVRRDDVGRRFGLERLLIVLRQAFRADALGFGRRGVGQCLELGVRLRRDRLRIARLRPKPVNRLCEGG